MRVFHINTRLCAKRVWKKNLTKKLGHFEEERGVQNQLKSSKTLMKSCCRAKCWQILVVEIWRWRRKAIRDGLIVEDKEQLAEVS